jgi:hypothetical protein
MVRHASVIAGLCASLAVVALGSCSGGKKPVAKKPVVKDTPKPPDVKPETEDDRDKKRKTAAQAIIPDGTTCLPVSLKEAGAPRLELAAVKNDAVICAIDGDRSRLLGPIACWKVDLGEQSLVYQEPAPLPGRNLTVKLDDRCARGFCLPKEDKLPDDKIVHMAWSDDGAKVVVLAGDQVEIFDATARARESGFSIRGDKGATGDVTAVHWLGNTIFVEAGENVFLFRNDGTAVGPFMSSGGKETMLSTHGGSFLLLGSNRAGISEKGFTAVTTYDVDGGKRVKIPRKVNNGPCKASEVDAFWNAGEVGGKCKEHMTKTFGVFVGADAVLGRTSFLVLLRGARLGELAVLDAKLLNEKSAIKLPWCESAGADGGDKADKADKADKEKPKTRAASPKKPTKEDPDQGGQ